MKHYQTVDPLQKESQVGRGLFGIRVLILHFKFQFSKSVKSSTFHIFLNLTYPLRKNLSFPKHLKITQKFTQNCQIVDNVISIGIWRRLKRDRDIGRKAVLSDVKTAFTFTPALTAVVPTVTALLLSSLNDLQFFFVFLCALLEFFRHLFLYGGFQRNRYNDCHDSTRHLITTALLLIYLKVHLTPKKFFRLNNSLPLLETHCAFLPHFSPNLDFLQAVKVKKSGHDRARGMGLFLV